MERSSFSGRGGEKEMQTRVCCSREHRIVGSGRGGQGRTEGSEPSLQALEQKGERGWEGDLLARNSTIFPG